MTLDIFETFDALASECKQEFLAPGATILRKFARPYETALLSELDRIIAIAPFRHMQTPGGNIMSVGMTNCGQYGWVSDTSGYRYSDRDPLNACSWPSMPSIFSALAADAASEAGFFGFSPDACLINCYKLGAKLSLHQDKDEQNFTQPIVSVSLGIPAVFLFGGFKRNDKCTKAILNHNDVVIWGGPSRLRYHGILPIGDNFHPTIGHRRINLTFRHIF